MPIYRDIYTGPPRWYGNTRTAKRYVAIHATANDASAEAEASWAQRRPDSTSSHYYVDDDSIVQSLDTDLRAFHAGSRRGNDLAISYELTARNMSVGRAWWLDHDNIEWPLMVGAIARDCAHFGITPRNLTVAEITAGRLGGIIDHNEMRQAWGGTDHTDPGPNFPMDHLVNQVRAAMEDDDDMDLIGTRVKMADDDGKRWSFGNTLGKDSITANAALGYSAAGGWLTQREVAPGVAKLLAGQAALLAQMAGEDVAAAVRAELDQFQAEIDAALDQAAAQRQEILELVAQVGSGERDAAAVVDEIGRRLADAPES